MLHFSKNKPNWGNFSPPEKSSESKPLLIPNVFDSTNGAYSGYIWVFPLLKDYPFSE
jgi:hypothetical protein